MKQTNNLKKECQESKKDSQRIRHNSCQYKFAGCQKTAEFQHILKLGLVKIDKGWICLNCKELIEQSSNQKK